MADNQDNKPNEELLRKLVDKEIRAETSDLTVLITNHSDCSATSVICPASTASDVIVHYADLSSSSDLNVKMNKSEKVELYNAIEEIKKKPFWSKISGGIGFDPEAKSFGAWFSVEREPGKTVIRQFKASEDHEEKEN